MLYKFSIYKFVHFTKHDKRTECLRVAKTDALDVEVLPHNERLNGTHLEAVQRLVDAKHVLICVLRDLLEELRCIYEYRYAGKSYSCAGSERSH